jgi:hypothetical protein
MPAARGGAWLPERVRGDPLAAAARLDPGGTLIHRRTLHAALITTRPKQWVKNALVVAAAGAAGALGHDDVPVRVGVTCVAFCLLASGI